MQQVPIYNEKLMSVNDWIREFKDYCRGRNLLGIIMGTEPRGSFLSQDHENRRRLAFSAICYSMKSHPTICKSKMLDDFRNESDPDPCGNHESDGFASSKGC
jgi:hypothetical protein